MSDTSTPHDGNGVNQDTRAARDRAEGNTRVYLEAYVKEAEPKVSITWCAECDTPVVEGKKVVATFSYQEDIDRFNRLGYWCPQELIEALHERCWEKYRAEVEVERWKTLGAS